METIVRISARQMIGLAAGATAASVTLWVTPAQATGTIDMGAKPKSGVSAAKVRTGASTSAAALGQVNAGQYIRCWYPASLSCNTSGDGLVTGGSYSCNGTTSNKWLKVSWNRTAKYVAYACVNITSIPPGTNVVGN
jgi:hypothetical protein